MKSGLSANLVFCCLLTFSLLSYTQTASIKSHLALNLKTVDTDTSDSSESSDISVDPIIPEPCDVDPNDHKPKKFEDGLMSPPGRFISCMPSGMVQMMQMKQSKNEEFQFKRFKDSIWTIRVKTRNSLFGITRSYFMCAGLTPDDSSKLKLTFLDENRVIIENPPKYASTVSPFMGTAVDTQTKSEVFWLTSIPHHPISTKQVLPNAACRNAQCSIGVLRFTTGWFINGNLDACPTEKLLDLYAYRSKRPLNNIESDFVVVGYGGGQYFLYVTPEGTLSNLIQTQTRYSLFRKITKENGTFLLQAWNGYYLGHTLGTTKEEQKVILIKEESSSMIIFGYK